MIDAGVADDFHTRPFLSLGDFLMTAPLTTMIKLLPIVCCLLIAAVPAGVQAGQLTDEQIREIELHYNLDKYMVGGCILGATFSSIVGFMTLSGMTVVAAVPYIATGCSMGFLIGASSMLLYNFFDPLAALPETPDGGIHSSEMPECNAH
jgi:hypothetical protein